MALQGHLMIGGEASWCELRFLSLQTVVSGALDGRPEMWLEPRTAWSLARCWARCWATPYLGDLAISVANRNQYQLKMPLLGLRATPEDLRGGHT